MLQQVVEAPSSMFPQQAEGMQVCPPAAQVPEGFMEKSTHKIERQSNCHPDSTKTDGLVQF